MLCYLDRTFCVAKCVNAECPRRLTKGIEEAAIKWWNRPAEAAPISVSNFSGTCPDFMPVISPD